MRGFESRPLRQGKPKLSGALGGGLGIDQRLLRSLVSAVDPPRVDLQKHLERAVTDLSRDPCRVAASHQPDRREGVRDAGSARPRGGGAPSA